MKFKELYFFIALLVSALCASAQVYAADKDGKFAVKGAGKRECAAFSKAFDDKSTDYYMYGGWLEGYLSSYNQVQDKAYDITPWQTTELMLFLLSKHCETNPKTKFLTAVNGLIKSFFPVRLKEESSMAKIAIKNTHAYYYSDVLKMVQNKLIQHKYFNKKADGNWSTDMLKGILQYQKQFNLTASGYPDQQTLTHMLLRVK